MSAPYARRQLQVSFQLGKGSFGDSGYDTVTFKAPSVGAPGMQVYLEVEQANLPQQPNGVIRIYGMTLDHMNQLSVAGRTYQIRNDKIRVDAGDVGGALTTVFQGTIVEAYPDFTEMPNTAFHVQAVGGAEINLKPVEPTSFEGATPAGTALGQIVQKCGLTLENAGVNAILSNPYFPGAGMTQINRAVAAANCFGTIDSIGNKLAVWPKNGHRDGDPVAFGPNTGMIGYPSFQQIIIRVRSRFDPALMVGPGKRITVDSQLASAKGEWIVQQISLNLAAEVPGGPWEMMVFAARAKGGTTATVQSTGAAP